MAYGLAGTVHFFSRVIYGAAAAVMTLSVAMALWAPAPFAAAADTTTSGVLRDADTGAAITGSCVAFSSGLTASNLIGWTSVNGDGTWSFTTTQSGPFTLAFYATSSGDCSQTILSSPVPSWYSNQPLTGTEPSTLTPPIGATAVDAGTSGIVACLGRTELPTSACAIPETVLSGTVVTTNNLPVVDACVVVLTQPGLIGLAITDAEGRWSVDNLPNTLTVVVGFIPNFSGPSDPCNFGNGPPPVPPAEDLQPVFFGDVWIDLGSSALLADPVQWAISHGATIVTESNASIDACLTNTPGSIAPRPSCAPATETVLPAASVDSQVLAASGENLTALFALSGLLPSFGIFFWLFGRRLRRETTSDT